MLDNFSTSVQSKDHWDGEQTHWQSHDHVRPPSELAQSSPRQWRKWRWVKFAAKLRVRIRVWIFSGIRERQTLTRNTMFWLWFWSFSWSSFPSSSSQPSSPSFLGPAGVFTGGRRGRSWWSLPVTTSTATRRVGTRTSANYDVVELKLQPRKPDIVLPHLNHLGISESSVIFTLVSFIIFIFI